MEDSFLNSAIFQEGGGLTIAAPPINNACLPTIYDKLDAEARSKVKVINRMLDKQLRVQEKIIYKHQHDALRIGQSRKDVVERDLERILRRYPNMDELPFLSLRLNVTKKKETHSLGMFKAYSTEAIGIKGIPSTRSDDPFCDRYYCHHLKGFRGRRNRKLAPLEPLPQTEKAKTPHISRSLILSKKLSVSDHVLHNKLQMFYKREPIEEDAMTV